MADLGKLGDGGMGEVYRVTASNRQRSVAIKSATRPGGWRSGPPRIAEASQQEHVLVMLQNFSDELRRRVPLGK
jgi:hypothetical protein